MSLRRKAGRLLSDLTGRSDRRTVGFIAEQAALAEQGALLAKRMAEGEITTAEARRQMAAIEHAGDDERAALVSALGQSLTTPIDREDLYRLSRSVDDVLDNLRDYVRESDLYRPVDQQANVEMIAAIAAGMAALQHAVGSLIKAPRTVAEAAVGVRKQGNNVRRLYQLALASLFDREVDVEMFKQRELLRRIDVVALRMGEAADALTDGMLKRSH